MPVRELLVKFLHWVSFEISWVINIYCSTGAPWLSLLFALWPLPFTLRLPMPSFGDAAPSGRVKRTGSSDADLPCSICKTVLRLTCPHRVQAVQWQMRCCPRWWKLPLGLFLTFCFLQLEPNAWNVHKHALQSFFSFGQRACSQLNFGFQCILDMKVSSELWSTRESGCTKSHFFCLSPTQQADTRTLALSSLRPFSASLSQTSSDFTGSVHIPRRLCITVVFSNEHCLAIHKAEGRIGFFQINIAASQAASRHSGNCCMG